MAPPRKPKPTADIGFRGPIKKDGGLNLGAPPPLPTKKTGNAWQQFVNYWAAHGYKTVKQNAADIKAAADQANIDPIYFASLLMLESHASYKTSDSSAGAIGIGQLMPSTFVGQPLPWNTKHKITLKDLRDPTTNLRIASYFIAQKIGKFGYAGAYSGQQGTYNPYYTGNAVDPKGLGPLNFIQKWNTKYVINTPGTGPPGKAGQQVPGGSAPAAQDITFKDPYVAYVKKGNKFGLTNNPNKAMQYEGVPLKRSDFLRVKNQWENWFISYTGKRPSNTQIQNVIRNAWTPYTVANLLSNGPNFTKSPIWKEKAPEYMANAKAILAPGEQIPSNLVKQAIINNWSESAFQEALRKRPQYIKSAEFKGNVTALVGVHTSIMGAPDNKAQQSIAQAAIGGWDVNQYASWLRSQPEYNYSPEYQSKTLSFLEQLGLLAGKTPVLSGKIAPRKDLQTNTMGTLPNDKRLPAAGGLTQPNRLGAGYLG